MKISVILPAFNEEKIITKNATVVNDFLSKEYDDYELIIVDDGSTDKTLELSNRLVEENENIKVVTYPFNRGKGAAVKAGVAEASGDCILFTDSDLAYNPKYLKELVEKLNDADMAIGSRYVLDGKKVNRAKYKIKRGIVSKCFIGYTNFILKTNQSDIQAGIKGFKKEVAKDIFNKLTIFGFGFDVEVLALAKVMKAKTVEIPVEVTETRKSSKVRIFRDSIKMFFNVIGVRFRVLV